MKLFNDNSWRESRSSLGFVMMLSLCIQNQTRRNITSLTIIKFSKDNIFRYDIYTKQGITDDLIWSSNCVLKFKGIHSTENSQNT